MLEVNFEGFGTLANTYVSIPDLFEIGLFTQDPDL